MRQVLDGAPPNYSQPVYDGSFPVPVDSLWVSNPISSPYSGSDVVGLYSQYKNGGNLDVIDAVKKDSSVGLVYFWRCFNYSFLVVVLAFSGYFLLNYIIFLSSVLVWFFVVFPSFRSYLDAARSAVRRVASDELLSLS